MKKRFFTLFLALMLLALPAMAEPAPADCTFTLLEGNDASINGLVFQEDVIINGNHARLNFTDCTFFGDIILTSEEGTMVFLMGCSLMGKCIQRNSVQEATIDYSLPKFVTDKPVELVLEDCLGGVVVCGDFPVVFAGQVYTMAQSQQFVIVNGSEVELVPYEGQEADYFIVCRWWENGSEVVMVLAEAESEG